MRSTRVPTGANAEKSHGLGGHPPSPTRWRRWPRLDRWQTEKALRLTFLFNNFPATKSSHVKKNPLRFFLSLKFYRNRCDLLLFFPLPNWCTQTASARPFLIIRRWCELFDNLVCLYVISTFVCFFFPVILGFFFRIFFPRAGNFNESSTNKNTPQSKNKTN